MDGLNIPFPSRKREIIADRTPSATFHREIASIALPFRNSLQIPQRTPERKKHFQIINHHEICHRLSLKTVTHKVACSKITRMERDQCSVEFGSKRRNQLRFDRAEDLHYLSRSTVAMNCDAQGADSVLEPELNSRFVTTRELSNLLHVPEGTLRQWRCSGVGPRWHKLRGSVRYDRAQVEEFIHQSERFSSVRGNMEENAHVVSKAT